MEFLDCVKTRRSVRRFTDEPLSQETVRALVEAAAWSPSWKNTQISRYNLVTDGDTIRTIAHELNLGFEPNVKTIMSAPALVVVSYVTGRSGFERDGSFSTPKGDGFEMFDAGVACQTLCLAAHDMGLGTVILGYFDEERLSALIDLPADQKIAAVIALGHPKFQPEPTPRKSVDQLLVVK